MNFLTTSNHVDHLITAKVDTLGKKNVVHYQF